ncbi:hypothetical protein [Candidatus Bandiella numerosa]|uniref:hypothetical protein n=1 Tax=Candidatus Bandiella numerosa TaxID=2570586 RepID=UPI001F1BE3FD|nr:hypothetical protein [Candidatus Bandiella numerosa]
MWLKKPVSVERSKSKIAILLILNVVILGELMQVNQVKGEEYNFNYIDDYKKEAKEYVGETGKGELSNQVKELDGYTEKPKESGYSEYELRSKGDARVKGQEKDENEGVREAIGAAKSSYAENPHRSNYTVGKLQHKEFIKKSDAVTSNPISGLNVEGKTECKIADKDVGGENVEFEEYYVDVEDSRLIREDKKCEEDEDRLFYCEKILNVSCQMKKCDVVLGKHLGPGGVANSYQSGLTWKYNYPNIIFTSESTGYAGQGLSKWKSCVNQCHQADCCKTTIAIGTFELNNISYIREFKLRKVGFDNHGMIKMNGVVVYNTWGGDKLEIANECHGSDTYVDAGNGKGGRCSQYDGTNLNKTVNIELRPYLKNGWNQLEVTWIYARQGQFNIEIEARQECCAKLIDEWDGDCPL